MANKSGTSRTTEWYGHFFDPKPICDLPRLFRVADDNNHKAPTTSDYSVDYAGAGDEAACRQLVLVAREAGDNVGLGEYGEESDFITLLGLSEVFVVRRQVSSASPGAGARLTDGRNEIEAAIAIQPSLLSRTFDNCLAHIHVFRCKELMQSPAFYRHVLRLAVDLARSLDVGYTRCIARVAGTLQDLVQLYRQEGFVVVVSIEEGVKLAGVGSTVDLVMVNSISFPQRPIVDLAYHRYKESCSEEREMLPVPFLPQDYVFSSGFRVRVREMKPSEWTWAYSLWVRAAGKGQGYGLDECPTMDCFREFVLMDHYCVVLEELDTSRPIGYTLVGDSWYTRNPDSRLGETSLFIEEEFRGRSLGKESTFIELSLLKELGYLGSLNDILLSNSRMSHVLRSGAMPPRTVGTIPDGTYTAGYGWDDQVIMYADLKDMPTFSQIAKESLKRTVATDRPASRL